MVGSERLTTRLLVESVLALANREVVVAVLERRGSAEHGVILVRLDMADGLCRLESRVLGLDGEYEWQDVTGAEGLTSEEAGARIAREVEYDSDLWVVAVDASQSDNPFRQV